MKSPLIVALVALLVLVALPLYLIRRPKPIGPVGGVDAGAVAELIDAGAAMDASSATASVDAGGSKKVALGEPHIVKCVPKGGGHAMPERCDHLVALEDALIRSIRENVACAPPSVTPYSVSFVLTVEFERKKLHLWAGRSGTLKKRNSADLVRCVEHAISAPDLGTVAHQYSRYDINVIASYPGGASGMTLGGS